MLDFESELEVARMILRPTHKGDDVQLNARAVALIDRAQRMNRAREAVARLSSVALCPDAGQRQGVYR